MEVTMPRVTASLTFLMMVVCCVDAGSINFPRMGRSNTMTFPRTGRSNILGFQRPERSHTLAYARMGRSDSLAFPRMGRSPGLYFPRMGRANYLAFPRMGRRSDVTIQPPVDCCNVGFKTLVLIGQGEKADEVSAICQASVCCEGLKESWDKTRVDDMLYSVCEPDADLESDHNPSSVYDKLKRLIPAM